VASRPLISRNGDPLHETLCASQGARCPYPQASKSADNSYVWVPWNGTDRAPIFIIGPDERLKILSKRLLTTHEGRIRTGPKQPLCGKPNFK
jgi:hypothetical protein